MTENTSSGVGKLITDYIVLTEMSRHYGKKQVDLEKEYNRLLNHYNGEVKNYSLGQADKIYLTYTDMKSYADKSRVASENLIDAEKKLQELGKILFESTVHAQIEIPAINGNPSQLRSVRMVFQGGKVQVC
jgi:hypothetical protein